MKLFKIAGFFFIAAFIYIIYKSVYSLPNEYVKQASDFQRSYTQQKISLNKFEQSFKDLQSKEDWAFLQPYSQREEWQASLNTSRTKFDAAEKLNTEVISPIIERDHEDGINQLVKAIIEGKALIASSIVLSDAPSNRIKLILLARDNKDSYFDNTKKIIPAAKKITADFIALANTAQKNHLNKTEDINNKISEVQKQLSNLNQLQPTLVKEHSSRNTDFALYGDTYAEIITQDKQLKELLQENSKLILQLDRSYVKILADQKVDYFIVIGRSTWCEGDYCNAGDTYKYPKRQVDADTFNYFESLKINPIAEKGWGSLRYHIPNNRWTALKINPRRGWSSSHDYAEFWVDNMFTNTYHKYSIIENETVKELDWEPVDNEVYWNNEADLGMAIATKPLGFYESEIITSAEPAGMSMIAKPVVENGIATGSNQYGEWRQSSGHSFWHYYGMYSMFSHFMPSNRYSYNQWNGYNSASRGSSYYGRNNEYGTYGASTYSNPRYKNSAYSHRNPSVMKGARSGKFSRVINSVRGAGPSGRGRGPSGGGK